MPLADNRLNGVTALTSEQKFESAYKEPTSEVLLRTADKLPHHGRAAHGPLLEAYTVAQHRDDATDAPVHLEDAAANPTIQEVPSINQYP